MKPAVHEDGEHGLHQRRVHREASRRGAAYTYRTTRIAAHAQEALREDSAVDEDAELAFPEAWQTAEGPGLCLLEEALQMAGVDPVKVGLLGTPPKV